MTNTEQFKRLNVSENRHLRRALQNNHAKELRNNPKGKYFQDGFPQFR